MPPQQSEIRPSRGKRKYHRTAGSITENKKRLRKTSEASTIGANETATAASEVNATVTPHRLCSVCTECVSKSRLLNNRMGEIDIIRSPSGWDERWEHFNHYSSLEALHASSRAGCHLCTLLCTLPKVPDNKAVNQLVEDRADQPPKALGTVVQLLFQVDTLNKNAETIEPKRGSYISMNMELDWHIGCHIETNRRRALHVYPTEYVRAQAESPNWEASRDDPIEVVHDAQISVSTGSAASFDLASKWLSRCKKEHAVCRRAVRSTAKFPKRLLDLMSDDCQTIRLRVDLGRKEYVSLSHRWGNPQPLRLLEANIEAFQKEIDPVLLPPTFRDAVITTRKLGYRYLWIDSLCIIQDSKEDWVAESAIMGQIYRGSALNISAGGAEDSNSGYFFTRQPLRHRPCILTGNTTEGFCIPRHCPVEWWDSDRSSTVRRGWIFQERMLAARTLHYNRQTISWECISQDASEGWPDGDTWDWHRDSRYRRPKEIFQTLCDFRLPAVHSPSALSNPEAKAFYQAWSKLVSDYTSKNLTQSSDRLVAVNGIMSLVAESTGLHKAAGLWTEFLYLDLLWSRWSPGERRPELDDETLYRAPSWSWASVDAEVRPEYANLHGGRNESVLGLIMGMSYTLVTQCRVRGVKVSGLPNGQVSYGHLRVRGRLRKMAWWENAGAAGRKHNFQARSGGDRWAPDFRLTTEPEPWGLLVMTGTGPENVKDARIDVILALERVEAEEQEWVFRRAGYAHQLYWKKDRYPVFQDDREELEEEIYLI